MVSSRPAKRLSALSAARRYAEPPSCLRSDGADRSTAVPPNRPICATDLTPQNLARVAPIRQLSGVRTTVALRYRFPVRGRACGCPLALTVCPCLDWEWETWSLAWAAGARAGQPTWQDGRRAVQGPWPPVQEPTGRRSDAGIRLYWNNPFHRCRRADWSI
jgi:hypothetical protein